MTQAGAVEYLDGSNAETIIVRIAGLISQHGALAALVAGGVILAGIWLLPCQPLTPSFWQPPSSVSQNIFRDFLKINMSEKKSMLTARCTVIAISVIAVLFRF